MAELTRQDIQQAVQVGIQRVQGDVQRLASDMSSMSNKIQMLGEVQRELQALQGQAYRHDPRSEQSMIQLQRKVSDIKAKVDAIERFCREMSEYFRARDDFEREDREYRSTSG